MLVTAEARLLRGGRSCAEALSPHGSTGARGHYGGELILAHVIGRPELTDDMLAHSTPEDGDIVVRQETREGMDVFVLHTAGGADQYLLRRREDAIVQAVTFAKRQGVRAWLCGETYDFVLLNDSPAVEPV